MATDKKTKILLLLPAYNESRRIGQVLREAAAFAVANPACGASAINDIVVIDDGSTDSTREIVADSQAVCPTTVLTHTPNRGKGFALRKGFAYALANGYDAVFTMDSDGQHAPADIPRFLAHWTRTQPDILIGARVKARGTMPLHRRINNALISCVGSKLCKQRVPDFQSGYRLIRATVLRQLKLETERYETETELLIKAGQHGFRIESLPIAARYGDYRSDIKPLRDVPLFTKLFLSSAMRFSVNRSSVNRNADG